MNQNKSTERQKILAANEVYHDLEGEEYASLHPEIFLKERRRWKRIIHTYFAHLRSPRTVLDLGCGTGFVSMLLASTMQKSDLLCIADISQNMLDITKKNVERINEGAEIASYKLHDETLPLATDSVDMVVMNSVLHHIPDVQKSLMEIDRVLRPSGTLVIGHEPNIRFVRNYFLQIHARIFHAMHPKRIVARMTRRRRKLQQAPRSKILDRVNAELMAKKIIAAPLTSAELAMFVDAHSPTAGGQKRDEGFDPWNVLVVPGRKYEILEVETYNHLGKESGKYWLCTPYEWLLHKIFPRHGAQFLLVARKV